MSRSIDDEALKRYLQWRVQRWIAEGHGTGEDLAIKASVSPATISNMKNEASVGWGALVGLGRAFGMTIAQLEEAAHEWARTQPAMAKPQGNGVAAVKSKRLDERPEWTEALSAAALIEPLLPPEAFERVGRIPEDPLDPLPRLDGPVVASVAADLHKHRVRSSTQAPIDRVQAIADHVAAGEPVPDDDWSLYDAALERLRQPPPKRPRAKLRRVR